MENNKRQIVRKLQKSATGFYINVPKKLANKLNLNGTELIKFTTTEQANKFEVEIINVE